MRHEKISKAIATCKKHSRIDSIPTSAKLKSGENLKRGLPISTRAHKPLPSVVSTATARTQLDRMLDRVKKNQERFVIDKRGEPQAVLMSIEDFIRTIAPENQSIEAIRENARGKGVDKLSMRQINAEIAAYRKEQKTKRTKSAARDDQAGR